MDSLRTNFLPSLLVLAATVLGARAAAAGVIVVDASGGGQFTNLQIAVDAAQDGDTLLVQGGAYSSFQIDAKGISVVAETAEVVTVNGSVVVRNLAAEQTVVLAGLAVSGATTVLTSETPGVALLLANNAGKVRAQACVFQGAKGWGDGTTGSASWDCCILDNHPRGWDGVAAIGNSGGTAFVDCSLRGGRGANAAFECYCGTGGPGGDGLRATNSLVALYDCTLSGGRGGSNGYQGGGGGAACRTVSNGSPTAVHASGSSFQGGDGGDGYDYIGSVGGVGGDGLVTGVGTTWWTLESTFECGVGGEACFGAFPDGPDGSPTSGAGALFTFDMPRLRMTMPAVVREQTGYVLTVHGRPSDQVYVDVTRATQFVMIPSWHGVRLVKLAKPAPSMILGAIPASGVLTTSLPAPALGSGVESETLFLQAWRIHPLDGRTFGSFAALTVLDSSY